MTHPDSESFLGREFAHFSVIEKLGEGGMGAVYRARDTRLGRDVALKVLPDELSADEERLARLRREAQVLAAVNHPNVASIYGVEEAGGRLILVLELVDGEDLAQRLKRGALPVDEALDIAAQIATGLEAAHDRGMVHRDLKPANVMITGKGVVKVLDFGLAKPYAGENSGEDVSDLATVTGDEMTREGVIMGTASYMSPEQARGRPVDGRSDVWSFGCVLFEMLSGRRAFGGETMTDVLVAVVTGEPDWSLLPPSTPPGVLRLLRRCLRRDPRNRLRNLGDAALEIAEASDSESDPGRQTAVAPASNRNLTLWAIVGPLLGVALGLALWWVVAADPPSNRRPVRRLATVSEPVAVYESFAPSLAVSPDTGRLVYAAGHPRRLFGQLRDQFEPAPIAGTDGALGPFFSPDGRSVGFWSDDALKRIPVGGGTPVTLCDAPSYFFGATWAPDGHVYFSRPWVLEDGTVSIALVRVPEDGGTTELVEAAESEDGRTVGLAWPTVLPDGRNILITRWVTSGRPPAIEVLSLDDGSRRTVIEGVQQAVFVPTGHLVAATPEGQLVAVPFDPDTREATGNAAAVAAGVHRSRYGAGHFAVAADGAIYWVPETGASRPDELVWVDREGGVEPASSHRRHYEAPRLSPDGFVVVGVRSAHDDTNIWILDTVRDTLRPLTIGRGHSLTPLWAPDRLGVAYSVPLGHERLPAGIYLRSLDAQSDPEQLVPGSLRIPSSMSADGGTLLFHTIGPESGWDLWRADLASGAAAEPLLSAPYDQTDARLAPDGRWIAFEANASGRGEIYVRDTGGRGIEGQVSPHGGTWPVWNPRGDELLYLGEESMMSVVLNLDAEPSAEPARPLFEIAGFARTFDLSADGRRFLMIRLGQEPVGRQINLTLDWIAHEPGEGR
ncbi:MAG: protein kinase [Candidatus Sulfomarinibacteraceae bacterium]